METFTASNGRVVEFNASRFLVIDQANSLQSYTFSPEQTGALREFFQAERDQELGRWRDPDFRSMVCYPEKESVSVLNELTGKTESWTKKQSSHDINRVVPGFYTASRYFAAHPVSKPLPSEPHTAWVDKYGTDIWWVDGAGVLRCCASTSSDPAKYAPFTRLVPEVPSE